MNDGGVAGSVWSVVGGRWWLTGVMMTENNIHEEVIRYVSSRDAPGGSAQMRLDSEERIGWWMMIDKDPSDG